MREVGRVWYWGGRHLEVLWRGGYCLIIWYMM